MLIYIFKYLYIFLLLCLQQGDGRNDSVEEEQAVVVLDMTGFIEFILSVKTVGQIHFKMTHLRCTLWSLLEFLFLLLQMLDRGEKESREGSLTDPLLEGLNRQAGRMVTILLIESLPDSV